MTRLFASEIKKKLNVPVADASKLPDHARPQPHRVSVLPWSTASPR